MERASRETWAKRVERWKESGLTAKEFSAEIGINAHSLSWWQWRLGSGAKKLARAATATMAKSRPTKPRRRSTTSPLTFVEMTAAIRNDALEVILPSSIRVCVGPEFDTATLGRLLDLLEARR